MKILLYEKQVNIIAEFMSNMAVVWFAAAFISPTSAQSIVVHSGYGIFALTAAVVLKGVR